MDGFVLTPPFLASAYELPKDIARKVWKSLHFFLRDPRHPSLNVEKLSGKAAGLHSVRVDDHYRIVLRRGEAATALLFVGPHDSAYRFAQHAHEPPPKQAQAPAAPRPPMPSSMPVPSDKPGLVGRDTKSERETQVGEAPSADVPPEQAPPAQIPPVEAQPLPVSADAVKDLLLRTSKYLPLAHYLLTRTSNTRSLELAFVKIEEIIRSPLPPAARRHRPWWANERGPTRHVQATAWLSVGWKVHAVSLQNESVTFGRLPRS